MHLAQVHGFARQGAVAGAGQRGRDLGAHPVQRLLLLRRGAGPSRTYARRTVPRITRAFQPKGLGRVG